MAKSLYICYFGLQQPLVQTQVLPYLRELCKDGHEIVLLTFEPEIKASWPTSHAAEAREELKQSGIEWHYLSYHKRFSAIATAYDIFRGSWLIWRMIGKKKIDILHGRVHVPTLMGAIARKFSRRRPKLLFDIRGFFPEEYTDAGVWLENGVLFRSAKRVEKWLMKEADGFVVLTKKARQILFPEIGKSATENSVKAQEQELPGKFSKMGGFDALSRPVEVIPCCVDFEKRFSFDRRELRIKFRRELGVEDRFVFVHAGALGGLYLTEQIADFLAAARERDPKTFALFLTQSDPNLILPLLRERRFEKGDYFVGRVSPAEIPGYLCAADAGLSFVKAGYATQSRSPTKIPEYLASGIPIIANRGVGDVDELLLNNGVGVLIDDFSPDRYKKAFNDIELLSNIIEKCRETAVKEFDLERIGGDRYRRIYGLLANQFHC